MTFPTIGVDEVAWINVDAMREIDRIMVDDLGIALPQMMENAGRSLATVAKHLWAPHRVTVLAGPGGNGGGGMVAARHLHNIGVAVSVLLTTEVDRLTPVPRHQYDILERLGIQLLSELDERADVIVDAMVGYSLNGALRGAAANIATELASTSTPVVSLDIASGLNGDTAEVVGPAVAATATVTLCLPKLGLRSPNTGELYLADISVPPSAIAQVTADPPPPFDRGPILKLQDQRDQPLPPKPRSRARISRLSIDGDT